MIKCDNCGEKATHINEPNPYDEDRDIPEIIDALSPKCYKDKKLKIIIEEV